jgi:hypothetical protein
LLLSSFLTEFKSFTCTTQLLFCGIQSMSLLSLEIEVSHPITKRVRINKEKRKEVVFGRRSEFV